MRFQDLLTDYNIEAADYGQFVVNALLAALLTFLLSVFYQRHGKTVSNRSNFSNNFMLLALTTMLIIYIVKSSIALSLGLVGALSIVRFRAAIKEPEELTYLFLTIGIGLGMGANQPITTTLAFILIMAILYIKTSLSKNKLDDLDNQMVVNIASDALDEYAVNKAMSSHFDIVELRRMSHNKGRVYMTYVVEAKNFEQIASTKQALLSADNNLEFSFVDNKNMVG